jgi:hypothetical protein
MLELLESTQPEGDEMNALHAPPVPMITRRSAPTAPEDVDLPRRLREANNQLRDAYADSGPTYEIAFFCECARAGCYAPVWLTSAEYDCHIAGSRPIATPEPQASRGANVHLVPATGPRAQISSLQAKE